LIDLPSRRSIAYIDVRAFAHATEDIEKVAKAVSNILPTGLADEVVLKKTDLKGHYGNPIVLLETRIEKSDLTEVVFRKLASGLSSLDKEFLNSEIEQHLTKGNLFMRLDKQSAYLNEIRLRSDDPIHFRIHFRSSRLEEIMKTCRKSGMFP